MNARIKANIYEMTPRFDKIVEAIQFLIAEATRHRAQISQYEILKALFFSDKSHLNKYGRPITFDNYKAMPHGPVPSFSYDLLKENKTAIETIGGTLPWTRTREAENGNRYFYFSAKNSFDEEILSESDFEELQAGYIIVKSLTFSQIKQLTHSDPAYLDAWEDDSDENQFPMSYALLFEGRNDEKAAEIAFYSRYV